MILVKGTGHFYDRYYYLAVLTPVKPAVLNIHSIEADQCFTADGCETSISGTEYKWQVKWLDK